MTPMPCTCGGNGVCVSCVLAELDPDWNVPPGAFSEVLSRPPDPRPDPDLDELRASHEETARAALDLAARVAERVTAGPFDTGELALTHGLAASLTALLRRERMLRNAIKVTVAG